MIIPRLRSFSNPAAAHAQRLLLLARVVALMCYPPQPVPTRPRRVPQRRRQRWAPLPARMAIVGTGRVIPQGSGTSITSGGTMTPTLNSWFFASCMVYGTAAAIDAATFTMSGSLPTWTLLDTHKISVDAGVNKVALVIFHGVGDGGSAHTVTFAFGSSSLQGVGQVTEVTGTDISGTNGSGAIVQHPAANTSAGTPGTTASSTLSNSFGDANNAAFAITGIFRSGQNADAQTEKSGWTESNDRTVAGNPCGIECQYHVGEDLSPSSTWANASDWIQAAFEIKVAGGAGSGGGPIFGGRALGRGRILGGSAI